MTPEPRDVIAAVVDEFMVHPLETHAAADAVLAALRAAGYETYRPEECNRLVIGDHVYVPSQAEMQIYDQAGRRLSLLGDPSLGTYRLVRASDDTEGT